MDDPHTRALQAQVEVLRLELELKKREAELAVMQAVNHRPSLPTAPGRGSPHYSRDPAASPPPRRGGGPSSAPPRSTRLPYSGPPTRQGYAASRPPSYAQSTARPSGGRPWPADPAPKRARYAYDHAPRSQPPPSPPPYAAVTPRPYSASYARPQATPAPYRGAPTVPQPSEGARDPILKRLTTMQSRVRSDSLTKSILVHWAGDLLYDVFNRAQPTPSDAVLAQAEDVFRTLYTRIKADCEAGRQADWEPLGQEIKLFFEAGFRLRMLFRSADAQQTMFLQYVDVLNIFLSLPAEPPVEIPVVPGCWLRPTLQLGIGAQNAIKLQDHIVPDSLAPNDLVVELYWDLEIDIYRRSPEDVVDEATVARRKRGATKVALSILQNCDFSIYRPDETHMKAPPVVVVCHSKTMVLKVADSLNYLARYEYGAGYRGAEAAYRDTEGMSSMAVSVLVCTPGRLLAELKSRAVSLAAVRLLALTIQAGPSPLDFGRIVQQAPATARVITFFSTRTQSRHSAPSLAALVRTSPLRLLWGSSQDQQFRVEEYRPSQPQAPQRGASGGSVRVQPANSPKESDAQLPDFGVPELNVAIPRVLAKHSISRPTAVQRMVVPEMMTGDDRVFVGPDGVGTALGFVVPTVHLMLNYPAEERKLRVLVLAARIEDADRVVGEYLRFVNALPDTGLSAEGLHSQRLSGYETPFNDAAGAIVGTARKVANVITNRDICDIRLDLSAVDVLILYKLQSKSDLREVGDVYRSIVAARGAPQVVAFLRPHSAALAEEIRAELCPSALTITLPA